MKYEKYKPAPTINLKDRTWPDNKITKAPIWCSVDLRDGNQALEIPMNITQKITFFNYLVKLGFKEIEIGFPSASDTEYEFTRKLIEENLIPDDVTIQVLVQARNHLIDKTFESLRGAKRAIVHLYNSTSTLQRDVVFNKSKEEIIELALNGARYIVELAARQPETEFVFEYSPESFTGTEMDFAAQICNEVLNVFKPTETKNVIINLPSTVEMTTPNIYADQIEYICRHITHNNVIISLHAHNDRGGAVASTELGLLAGAKRVEGTLFGNGERTGNADILNIALNMFSQGIDPNLNFNDINEAVNIYEKTTGLILSKRHPYAGELVYTAFSGSHQDAIRKGMEKMKEHPDVWEVPYLPIDPLDVGRSYEPIIRINSQSGKGGVAFLLEQNYGLYLPKNMQIHFGNIVTEASDKSQAELLPKDIYDLFTKTYIKIAEPIELIRHNESFENGDKSDLSVEIIYNGVTHELKGAGNGILDAFCKIIKGFLNINFEIINYSEHAMETGSRSRAITYMEICAENESYFGAGVSSNISKSSLKSVVSALNKYLRRK